MSPDLVSKITTEMEDEFKDKYWRGSFDDFLERLRASPVSMTRTTYQYLYDMIEFFGSEEEEEFGERINRYRIFTDPFENKHGVYGLDHATDELVSKIRTTAKIGGDERILVLMGPIASAKTSIVKLLMRGMEEYSKQDEGALYRITWVFPKELCSKEFGFNVNETDNIESPQSYAHLDDKDIIAAVKCDLRDNPLLLIPREYREEFYHDILGGNEHVPKKLREGRLCYNCQNIFDYLMKEYKGSFRDVLKHIRVERFCMSEMGRNGLATVQSINNQESQSPLVVWGGQDYATVENILRGIELHRFSGKWGDANRGIIHFTDMFKRPSEYLQYLLSASQEHIIDFNGVEGYIDVMIIGTSNTAEYLTFKKRPMNAGLDDRIRKTNVPYVLNYKKEEKIYSRDMKEADITNIRYSEEDIHLYPHVLEIVSLWAVLTRLEKPVPDHYKDIGLSEEKEGIASGLTPLQKAKLYAGEIPGDISQEMRQHFLDQYLLRLVKQEHQNREIESEGMYGVSPRVIQNMLADITDATKPGECISTFRVLEGLEKIVSDGPAKYPFLRRSKSGGYFNFREFVSIVRQEYNKSAAKEVEWALIGIQREDVEKRIREYVRLVKSYKNGEMLWNPVTRRKEKPSEEKMKWVESKLGVTDARKDEFREQLMAKIGTYAIPSTHSSLDQGIVYEDLMEMVELGLYEEKKNSLSISLKELSMHILRYGTPQFEHINPVIKQEIEEMVERMVEDYNYCQKCAKEVIHYTLSENILK